MKDLTKTFWKNSKKNLKKSEEGPGKFLFYLGINYLYSTINKIVSKTHRKAREDIERLEIAERIKCCEVGHSPLSETKILEFIEPYKCEVVLVTYITTL
jgi:hypothetical protein